MRKLKLAIEDLQVESFSLTEEPGQGGTVLGMAPRNTDVPEESVDACNTIGTCVDPTNCCAATWKATCPYSCYATGECGSCVTWWCNTCNSCEHTCGYGVSCTDACANCSL